MLAEPLSSHACMLTLEQVGLDKVRLVVHCLPDANRCTGCAVGYSSTFAQPCSQTAQSLSNETKATHLLMGTIAGACLIVFNGTIFQHNNKNLVVQ